MKPKHFILGFIFALTACQPKEKPVIQTTTTDRDTVMVAADVDYDFGDKSYRSFVAYKGDSTELKPVVFIVPEWWGLNEYAKKRAKMLADEGYFAMALDFYGNGASTENPAEAQELATPYYANPALGKNAYEAAKLEIRNFPNADTARVAIIGYCFGGAQALNMGRQDETLKGAVSFHGNLMTGVKPNNNKVKMLVMNGEADTFVPQTEIDTFKAEMDSAGIDYQFINYPNAIHAFTNPDATAIGKKYDMKVAYNEEADKKSWNELLNFLTGIFNENQNGKSENLKTE
jgi:dienelactone hydrolase